MLGYRFWSYNQDSKGPLLKSISASFDWSGNVVGSELDYIAKINQGDALYFDEQTGQWVSYALEEEMDDFVVPELGFWAFKNLPEAIAMADLSNEVIVGAVNGFGKVAVHSVGWRAEYCQILGFLNFLPCTVEGHEDRKGNQYAEGRQNEKIIADNDR